MWQWFPKRFVVGLSTLLAGVFCAAFLAAQPPVPGKRLKGPPSPTPDTTFLTVRGTVKEFTTAPRGEVDGALLEDGTRLHWPPHLQDRFADVLKKGDRVRATGRTETGPAGDAHFEVQGVINLRTSARAENPDFANGPPPPEPRRLTPGRSADREQRLRDLEDQVDQLRHEIQRLRRER
jgi:hypothetical protein